MKVSTFCFPICDLKGMLKKACGIFTRSCACTTIAMSAAAACRDVVLTPTHHFTGQWKMSSWF